MDMTHMCGNFTALLRVIRFVLFFLLTLFSSQTVAGPLGGVPPHANVMECLVSRGFVLLTFTKSGTIRLDVQRDVVAERYGTS